MKYYAPDYYPEFACVADKCRHSCCVGWEIDIDDDSLEYYQNLDGETGDRLRANICLGEDGAHFRLTEAERCPFLNPQGLCDMIIALGEESLCQICADHPRFRNFFSDREEIGLGLCCEAAGALILRQEAPAKLQLLADDGGDEAPDADEQDLLELRDGLIAIAQDRSMPMEARLKCMLAYAEIDMPEFEPRGWAGFFLTLERLDDAWTQWLEALRSVECIDPLPCPEAWELPFEQLLVYLLQRHIPGALEDGMRSGRIALCALVWRMLRSLCELKAQDGSLRMEDMIELCRLYSSEIEYSDENIAAILDELARRIPGL